MLNTWYVAIFRTFGRTYFSFIGAESSSYKDIGKLAEKRGLKIIAERFDVSDGVVNRITGFDEKERRTSNKPLSNLAKWLNEGQKLDVQRELDRICAT